MKEQLEQLHDGLARAEESARPLRNQNLADIIHDALVKVAQALQHPDLDRVGKSEDQQDLALENSNPPADPLDPGTRLQAEEAARRAAFAQHTETAMPLLPDAAPSAPQEPAPLTFTPPPPDNVVPASGEGPRPGDPSVNFQNQNPDFRAPDNVVLNEDGTVKTAPNALGKSDDRDGSAQG